MKAIRKGKTFSKKYFDRILNAREDDPWNYFNGDNIPSRDSVDLAGKQGLLGGYLPAVNFGFYDANKMMVFEDYDRDELWLARAVPLSWFDDGFEISKAPTRWGQISLTVSPGGRTARLEFPNPGAGIKIHLYAPRLTSLLVNGKFVKYSRSGDFITW